MRGEFVIFCPEDLNSGLFLPLAILVSSYTKDHLQVPFPQQNVVPLTGSLFAGEIFHKLRIKFYLPVNTSPAKQGQDDQIVRDPHCCVVAARYEFQTHAAMIATWQLMFPLSVLRTLALRYQHPDTSGPIKLCKPGRYVEELDTQLLLNALKKVRVL